MAKVKTDRIDLILRNQVSINENLEALIKCYNGLIKDVIKMANSYNETVKANNDIAQMVADIQKKTSKRSSIFRK